MAHKQAIPIGKRFGRLTVLGLGIRPTTVKRGTFWECICDCGNRKMIVCNAITHGKTKACGCQKKAWAQHLRDYPRIKHGHTSGNFPPSPTYRSWQSMKARCLPTSASAVDYAQRGIKICEQWKRFENFLADMGERPVGTTIDRINNDGNYEPGNCRWATVGEQSYNRRTTVFLEHAGLRLPIQQWAMRIGIRACTIRRRLKCGDTVATALSPRRIPLRERERVHIHNLVESTLLGLAC